MLAVISTGAFMASLDASKVPVALPTMGPVLHLTYAAALWVQTAYLLAMAVLLLPLAKLADERGRFRFYLGGMAVFTAGSLLAALSTGTATLILGRVVQGAGGALLTATAAAILAAAFPARERGRALGVGMMATYAGFSAGPPLGGLLVDSLGWRWIFLVNLPIGAAVFVWGWRVRPPEPPPPSPRRSFDIAGTLWLGATLVCLLVPLIYSADRGWRSPWPWLLLGAAILGALGLLSAERRAANPVLDLRLLTGNRLFALSSLAAFLANCSLYAASVLTAMQLQLVHRCSAHLVGWILLGQPVMQAVLSPIFGHLSDRVGTRGLSTAGMLAVAGAMGWLALAADSAHLASTMGAMGLIGAGMSAFGAPNMNTIMGSVERHQLGTASAFQGAMRVLGQALSLAILGGIAAWRLSAESWRLLLRGGSTSAVAEFAWGYRAAMFAGAVLAVAGAWASLARGRAAPPRARLHTVR